MIEQPDVKVGEHTYCLVSGVVFEVKPESATRELAEKRPLWFCCESCAQHFDANRDKILDVRKIKLA